MSKYQISLETAIALRSACAPIFLPLFEHCLALAAHSHAAGYPQRASRELAHARKVARYRVCAMCGAPTVITTDRCSAEPRHTGITPPAYLHLGSEM